MQIEDLRTKPLACKTPAYKSKAFVCTASLTLAKLKFASKSMICTGFVTACKPRSSACTAKLCVQNRRFCKGFAIAAKLRIGFTKAIALLLSLCSLHSYSVCTKPTVLETRPYSTRLDAAAEVSKRTANICKSACKLDLRVYQSKA